MDWLDRLQKKFGSSKPDSDLAVKRKEIRQAAIDQLRVVPGARIKQHWPTKEQERKSLLQTLIEESRRPKEITIADCEHWHEMNENNRSVTFEDLIGEGGQTCDNFYDRY